MSLTLLNSEIELSSFPITQKIRLKCDDLVEINDLKNSIYLINIVRKDSLLNLSAPYNFNIGLIKKEYPTIDLLFKIVPENTSYIVEVSPTKPLTVSSTYMLLIVKELSEPFITIVKNNSKSKSNITVEPTDYVSEVDLGEYKVVVTSTTTVTDVSKITKVSVFKDNVLLSNKVINTSKNNSFVVNNLLFTFNSDVYVLNEEFVVTIGEKTTGVIDKNYSYILNTASDSAVTPLELENNLPSKKVDNSAVINFYNTSLLNKPLQYSYTYLDSNIIDIKLEGGVSKSDVDLYGIKASISVAFNNYLLNKLNLYDDQLKYIIKLYWDDFENSIRIVVLYSDNKTDPRITIDTSEW